MKKKRKKENKAAARSKRKLHRREKVTTLHTASVSVARGEERILYLAVSASCSASTTLLRSSCDSLGSARDGGGGTTVRAERQGQRAEPRLCKRDPQCGHTARGRPQLGSPSRAAAMRQRPCSGEQRGAPGQRTGRECTLAPRQTPRRARRELQGRLRAWRPCRPSSRSWPLPWPCRWRRAGAPWRPPLPLHRRQGPAPAGGRGGSRGRR